MRIRLIHLYKTRAGNRASRKEDIELDEVGIGRGTDNLICIPALGVPLHHSRIVRHSDGLRLEACADEMLIDGSFATSLLLRPGNVIKVGPTDVRVGPAEPGLDLVLEIERVRETQSERQALERRTDVRIERGLLSRRALSWIFATVILSVFLALPLLVPRSPPPHETSPTPPSSSNQLSGWLDRSWNVGTLSTAHASLSENCAACHRGGFREIRDAECLSCHATVGEHAPLLARYPQAERSCTHCHREHDLRRLPLGLRDRECIQCHGDLRATFAETELGDVRDFGNFHPEFRPTIMIDPYAERPTRTEVFTASNATPSERSGLHFSHKAHLAPDLRGPKGRRQLNCSSCHRVDANGEFLLKVSYAQDCRGCHPLTFSPAHPDREALHSKLADVRADVFEFFAAASLDGSPRPNPTPADGIRRPGATTAAEIEKERQRARAWALEQTREAMEVLAGEPGVCWACHERSVRELAPSVRPVRLMPLAPGDRFLPAAQFAHRDHSQLKCAHCHAAETSTTSAEILLPSIVTCRQCHLAEIPPANFVPSPCISCHRYHQPQWRSILNPPNGSAGWLP